MYQRQNIRNWYAEGREAVSVGGITQNNRYMKTRDQKMVLES